VTMPSYHGLASRSIVSNLEVFFHATVPNVQVKLLSFTPYRSRTFPTVYFITTSISLPFATILSLLTLPW
jgi:hypothetical protein